MDISEVERVLAQHPFLKKPKYVYVVEEPVTLQTNGMILFAGLTPKWRRDTIVLTPVASDVTVVHEVLHTMGAGEAVAYKLAPLLRWFRSVVPPLLRRRVKYKYASSPHPKMKLYVRD